MAPRVEKTEVFKKGWNFANRMFYELHNNKTLFSIMGNRNSVFSSFLSWNYFLRHWAICLCSQLEHFYIFKHKHKSNIIGAIFELKSSHFFGDHLYKEVLEVKRQACNFTGALSFTVAFEDFGHIFPTCFLENFS